MRILGIIPARYESSRFPGKPLAEIRGKTMIQRVYEQAMQATQLANVLVATDDERIFNHVKNFGGRVVMTASDHQNGTERCAEALRVQEDQFDAVINIQGDEPFIHPRQIDLVAQCLKEADTQIATLVKRITNAEEIQSRSVVKVVFNNNYEAMYFSRAVIPYAQKGLSNNPEYFKHIGIYGYHASVLEKIVQLAPSKLELTESLEQLRWLQNGYRIKVRETELESQAVDTPEDILKLPLAG